MPLKLNTVRDLERNLGTTNDEAERAEMLNLYVRNLAEADTSHLDGIEFDPAGLDDLEIVDGFYGIRDMLADRADTDDDDTDARAAIMETYIRSLKAEADARPVEAGNRAA